MKPTVGRIVHFFTADSRYHFNGQGKDAPIAAIITRVWGEGETPCVNLTVFGDCAEGVVTASSVGHISDNADHGWDWPARED